MNDEFRTKYGAWESNGLTDPDSYFSEPRIDVDLTDKELAKITRLRLISDPGFPVWDVSYCHGELKDGTKVRVQLPRHQFKKKWLKNDLVSMCKEAGVFAKGLGLLNDDNISKCQ